MKSLLSTIKKTAKTDVPKAKSTSGVPIINAPEIAVAVEKVRIAITSMKKAEADLDQYGDVVRDFFLETKETEARKMNFRKSFKFVGTNGTQVMVKHANKVLKINVNDTEQIQTILGDANFEMLFEETAAVFVKPEVLIPDSPLADKLMGFLGKTEEEQAENFALFFTSTVGLKIKTDYDRNIFRLPIKIFKRLGVFVKMIKPGIQ